MAAPSSVSCIAEGSRRPVGLANSVPLCSASTQCLPGLALQVMGKLIESEEDKFWLKEGGHLDYSR
mgnify:CR=1 FL=1